MCQLINVIGKIELGKKKKLATSNIMIDSGKDQQHMLNFHWVKFYWGKYDSQSLKASCNNYKVFPLQRRKGTFLMKKSRDTAFKKAINLSLVNKEN